MRRSPSLCNASTAQRQMIRRTSTRTRSRKWRARPSERRRARSRAVKRRRSKTSRLLDRILRLSRRSDHSCHLLIRFLKPLLSPLRLRSPVRKVPGLARLIPGRRLPRLLSLLLLPHLLLSLRLHRLLLQLRQWSSKRLLTRRSSDGSRNLCLHHQPTPTLRLSLSHHRALTSPVPRSPLRRRQTATHQFLKFRPLSQ